MEYGERLSANFWSGEFQCKCGCGFGLKHGDVSLVLVNGLEEVRKILKRPLFVVWADQNGRFVSAGSGCRCAKHNKKVGGVLNSQHICGHAADVWGPPVDLLAAAAEQVPCFRDGGVGVYEDKGFVHMDVRGVRSRWKG